MLIASNGDHWGQLLNRYDEMGGKGEGGKKEAEKVTRGEVEREGGRVGD